MGIAQFRIQTVESRSDERETLKGTLPPLGDAHDVRFPGRIRWTPRKRRLDPMGGNNELRSWMLHSVGVKIKLSQPVGMEHHRITMVVGMLLLSPCAYEDFRLNDDRFTIPDTKPTLIEDIYIRL
jgi:hypothetical protein